MAAGLFSSSVLVWTCSSSCTTSNPRPFWSMAQAAAIGPSNRNSISKRSGAGMFEQELSQLEEHHLLRRLTVVEPAGGAYVMIDNRRMLLMCSNDYLGLASHPALRQAACAALEQRSFGSGASRLVSGTSLLHRRLEERLAAFKRTEAALLFNSGYAANTGIIPAVTTAGDVILSDSLNHASIIDGCRLSKARLLVYRHKDVDQSHLPDLAEQHAERFGIPAQTLLAYWAAFSFGLGSRRAEGADDLLRVCCRDRGCETCPRPSFLGQSLINQLQNVSIPLRHTEHTDTDDHDHEHGHGHAHGNSRAAAGGQHS